MIVISRTPSRAFSLLELVIVIGIIAILIAMLLPAVQASRESARSMRCRSQLRQIVLAAHGHEGLHGHLPTGGWGWRWHGEPDRGFDARQPGGWIYNVLPFMEQAPLREVGSGLTGRVKAEALSEAAAKPVSAFVCPSRRSGQPLPFVHEVDFINMARPQVVARSDYAACSGDLAPDVSWGRGRGPQSLSEGDSPSFVWLETNRTGVVFRRSQVAMASITDGLSNTYLTGEKYVARAHCLTGTAENDDQHLLVGYDSDTLRTTDLNYPPLCDGVGVTSDHSFGSAHASTFNMAMADGSVVRLSYNIDLEVHRTRGNRRDGVAAPSP